MNNPVIFHPLFPTWLNVVLCLLFVSLVFIEVRKKYKFRTLRLVAQSVACLAVAALLFRPYVKSNVAAGSILLLTQGYKPAQADSILKTEPSLQVFKTEDCNALTDTKILSYADMEMKVNCKQIKYILGSGISLPEIERLNHTGFSFFPSQKNGIIKLVLPEEATTGRPAIVSGTIRSSAKTKLILRGPGGNEDSIRYEKAGTHTFRFSFRPKQAGRFVYYLSVEEEGREPVYEPMPVNVKHEKKLKILFLQKFPSAEIRSLKNYLSERKHAITIRSQTSKNNYVFEYANTIPDKVTNLTDPTLKHFDLVFIDAASLRSLSQAELTNLKNAVHDGLGVIVSPDEKKDRGTAWLPWQVVADKVDTVHLLINGRQFVLPKYPLQITSAKHIDPAIVANHKTLAGNMQVGLGHIGFMLLQETYQLNISGNSDDYATLWVDLISKTARAAQGNAIRITSSFPYYENDPIYFDLISDHTEVQADGNAVAMSEDAIIDNVWHSKVYAGKPGWHLLTSALSDSLHYFVCTQNTWQPLRIKEQQIANTIATTGEQQTTNELNYEMKEIPSVIFFLLFLICSAFNWLVPKL